MRLIFPKKDHKTAEKSGFCEKKFDRSEENSELEAYKPSK
jgi:hypothetical protein